MSSAAKIIERVRRVLAARGDAIVDHVPVRERRPRHGDRDQRRRVGVLFSDDRPPTLAGLHLDLEAELERAWAMPVQLVVLNRAPCDLVHRVLRDGIVVVDRDPSRRIRFEVRARNAYFDLKPYVDRYRRALPAAPR